MIIKTKDQYGAYELILKEVYYAPNLDKNITSKRRFDEKGFKLVTYKGVKQIKDMKEVFQKGYWNESAKMYQCKAKKILQGNETWLKKNEDIGIIGNRATVNLWHKRFGHVLALPKVCEAKGKLEYCTTCIEGKSKRKPMPASDSRYSGVLEIVHSNVC